MSEQEVKELPTPDDWTQLFESRFLHAADLLGRDAVLTISAVKFEEMPDPKKPKATKRMGSLVFEGKRKVLGLNRTNAACLKEMFGPKIKDWIGKRVVLYPTTVRMPKPGVKGVMSDEPCIRVRGSPDMAADVEFELQLPNKKPQAVKLSKMAQKGQPQAAKQPEPAPEIDPNTGEVIPPAGK